MLSYVALMLDAHRRDCTWKQFVRCAVPLAVHILDSRVICGFNMNSELEVMVTLPGVQNCPLNCLNICAKHNLH